jgi:hypothetical protein
VTKPTFTSFACTAGSFPKKSFAYTSVLKIFLMFSSSSFTVWVSFKSLIHLGLIFVYGKRGWDPVSETPFAEEMLPALICVLGGFVENQMAVCAQVNFWVF